MHIRTRILFISLSIVLGISIASSGIGLVLTNTEIETAVAADLTLDSEIADKLVSREISLLRSNAENIAKIIKGAPVGDFEKILGQQSEKYPEFIAYSVVDRSGVIVKAGNDNSLSSYLESLYTERALSGESFITTTSFNGDSNVVFHVYVPVSASEILIAAISGLHFSNLLESFSVYETGSMFMLDDQGTVIASKASTEVINRNNSVAEQQLNPTDSNKTLADFDQNMIEGNIGVGKYIKEGVEHICAYRPISSSRTGWSIGVYAPIKETPVTAASSGILISAFAIILLGAIVAFVASQRLAKPYLDIAEKNQHLDLLRQEADDASSAKSHFLANMSHEMRTPLNAVIGLTELQLDTKLIQDNPEARDDLTKVYSAGVTLLNLVNDILDLSKIEAGKLELIPVDYDLASLINDTTALNVVRIGSKPIEFILDLDKNLPSRLFGDDLRVKQVLNNLLSNAFKYTQEGQVTLKFRSQQEGDKILLAVSVSDTGIGIKQEDIDRLFGNYNQVSTTANRLIEGTGLGLSIARNLTQLMGGDISVKSDFGVGSTFSLTIEQGYINDVEIGQDVVDRLNRFDFVRNEQDKNAQIIPIKLPYAKVLLVDDVSTNLDVAKGMMKKYAMQIDTATSGQKAIDLITKAKTEYDAIFMDHMMPEMDGIEATNIIRTHIGTDYAKTVPIIAFTANAVRGSKEMFLENGFQDFLSKPLEIKQLDGIIKKWVRNKEKEQAYLELEDLTPEALTTNSSTNNAQDQNLEIKVAGLDFPALLERFGGDKDAVFEALASYAKNTPELLSFLSHPTMDNLPEYAIKVHGVKGSSYSICAMSVGQKAEELEHASKRQDLIFVNQKNPSFLDAAQNLITKISELLVSVDEQSPKPEQPAPDLELLNRLAEVCANYEMDEADKIIAELDQFKYQTDQDLVDWLKEQVNKSEFEKVKVRLNDLLVKN